MAFDSNFGSVMLSMPLNPSSVVSEIYLPTRELNLISRTLSSSSSAATLKNYPTTWVYGTGNNVALDRTTTLNLSATDLTVEAWCRLNTPGSDASQNADSQYILRAYETIGVFTNDVILGVDRSGRPFGFLGNGGVSIRASGSDSLMPNTWYHLAMVYTSATKKLNFFLNGVLVATSTATASSPAVFRYINLFQSAAGSAQIISGNIQDVRVTKAVRYTANFTPPGAFQILISGNLKRADGLSPKPVALFRSWPDMKTIIVNPDASGNWSTWLANCSHDVTYIANGAAPVAHGLYEIG